MRRDLARRLLTIQLFETYGGLLTARQQRLMRLYYFDDLSLGEIAERLRITRQAVHDSLQRSMEALIRLEEHLGLVGRPRPAPAPQAAPSRPVSAGRTPPALAAPAAARRTLRAVARRLRVLADDLDHPDLRALAGEVDAVAGQLAAGDEAGVGEVS
ncbi:MAG: sigma factor-like helix-turn-helix DNA-binding protein [Armatimonadota bacterium]|nr:sigma factor-like helix-turn-helix DNA-binding protein [Armatimonadota bacterium]MDR7449341.1 sigma factor-like helix-turn-helix DNA-binding protein [Armatimonadota bacterium]MDR7458788.1 sigma factor-like helix-turn-helix DNA-binding protein [Armatimonadota bacterium]MDR7480006.1 sigma factor-like helix-turn-helix DNA-binding protein [Armatimonadota bacterium]MDR7488604.1 sigma factor-like helix-turn-helix DNA-binding protein [Armatimonadota bacterium]